MSEPVKLNIRVIKAQYIEDADSILIQGQYKDRIIRHQIHRDCFSYGDRTEEQIKTELRKTAEMMIGKKITIVYDPELEGRIVDHYPLNY